VAGPGPWTSGSAAGRAVTKEPLNSNYIAISSWGVLRGPAVRGLGTLVNVSLRRGAHLPQAITMALLVLSMTGGDVFRPERHEAVVASRPSCACRPWHRNPQPGAGRLLEGVPMLGMTGAPVVAPMRNLSQYNPPRNWLAGSLPRSVE
jgi:hypothetical protein